MTEEGRPQPRGGWAEASKGMSDAYRWVTLPIGFVLWAMAAYYLGVKVDDWTGAEPWGRVVGAVAGFALGTAYVFWAIRAMELAEQKTGRARGTEGASASEGETG